MKPIFLQILTFIILTSCNQWSEDDNEKYMENCEKSFTKEECNCQLNKVKDQFNSFEEISENEAKMAEIFESCLDPDNNGDVISDK